MTLTSSSSSFEDLAAPNGKSTAEILLADSLLTDIEHFATHCVALRNLLGSTVHKNGATTGCSSSSSSALLPAASASSSPHHHPFALSSSACHENGTAASAKRLQVHAALALVSQSVRCLLLRYVRLFKTAAVLVATSQLVQKIKMAISDNFCDEITQSALHALQRLEDAIALSLHGALGLLIGISSIKWINQSQSIEFGDCCSLMSGCSSSSSVEDQQQHREAVTAPPPPSAAEIGTTDATTDHHQNDNNDNAEDADGHQLLLLSALLNASSSSAAARGGGQMRRRGTIGAPPIAEERRREGSASGAMVDDGTDNDGTDCDNDNGTNNEDDGNGTDCDRRGQAKKSQTLPAVAMQPGTTTTASSSSTNSSCNSNAIVVSVPEQQHQQPQLVQRSVVAKTTSCSTTSSSGVSSSPNNNTNTNNHGVSKISRMLVRRHSAFQLPQRFTAAATVAIGKLSGASPPPPPPATMAPIFHLISNNYNKNNHRQISGGGGGADRDQEDDDDDHDHEDYDGTADPLDQQSGGGGGTVSTTTLSHQLAMAAATQQLLKHTTTTKSSSRQSSSIADKIDDNKANVHISMQQLLETRDDGMELAFERCKAWSKYVSQLLQIVKLRLSTEEDYVSKLRRQSEQAKALLAGLGTAQTTTAKSVGQMPLVTIFERMMDTTVQHTVQAECALGAMQQRVVLTLENRQKEHDQRRRKLKTEWAKQRKQLDACVEDLRRAKQTHLNKDEHYLRAKELRQGQEFPPLVVGGTNNSSSLQLCTTTTTSTNGPAAASAAPPSFIGTGGGSSSAKDQLMIRKRFKEMEKRRKAEEEALHRKSDAENDVKRLERELEERMIRIHSLRHHTVNELSDLIRQCELTTIAATSTLLKSLADLWEAVPGQFHRLADASRSNAPGADFLSFLQSLPSSDSSCSSCWHDCDDVSAAPVADHHHHHFQQQHHQQQQQRLLLTNGIGITAANHNNNNNNNHCCNTTPTTNSINNNGTLSSSSAASFSVPVPATTTAMLATSSSAEGGGAATASPAGTSTASVLPSASFPCRVQQRRNALSSADDAPPAKLMMTPSQHKRRGKAAEMTARLFDMQSSSSSSTPIQPSDAARSHRLARTRQVSRCSQCGQLLIFDAVKCQCCGLLSHKKCLGSVQLWCGEKTAKRLTECGADRRMSIFGVPLSESLRTQHRKVPFILERCVAELEKRGMRCKGLYRTCGVKSKVEWICVQFEQIPSSDVDIDLSDVHPMNIASVVKLFLRRLPEPLLTHALYTDWLRLDTLASSSAKNGEHQQQQQHTVTLVHELRELVERLPDEAFTTLKFLVLHLNRVSWFEADNLMSVSNLAAVIAPSLMWPSNYGTHSTAISDAHRQSKAVELLTRHAHEVFDVNFQLDWRAFFDTHPNVLEPEEEGTGYPDANHSGECSSEHGDGGDQQQSGGDRGGDSRQHAAIDDCDQRGGRARRRGVDRRRAVDSEDEDELVENDDDEEEEDEDEAVVVDELLEDDDDVVEEEEEEEEQQLIMASADRHGHGQQSFSGTKNGGASPSVPRQQLQHRLTEKKQLFDKRLLIESYSSSDLECGSSAASTHHQQLFRAHHHHNQQQQQQPPLFAAAAAAAAADHNNATNGGGIGRTISSHISGRPPPHPPTVPSAPQSPLISCSSRSRQLSAAPRGSLPIAPGTAPQQRRVAMAPNAANGTGKKLLGERSYTTSILVSPHLRGMKEALTMDTDGGGNNKQMAAVQRRTPTPKLGLTQKQKSLEEMANCRLLLNPPAPPANNGGGTKFGASGGKLFSSRAMVAQIDHDDDDDHHHHHHDAAAIITRVNNDRNQHKTYHHQHQLQQQQQRNMVLSGEVTVQLKQDQHFLANEEKMQPKQPLCFKSAFLGSNDSDVSYV